MSDFPASSGIDRSFILATAGHVDHGKSSLVRALTGIDPDRLPEEKARGITIDLGFAHLRLSSPPGVSPAVTYNLGIVDVPGHEDFVKNMVSGVGAVDVALLVVAADDGWMPQTQEHLEILTYLGAPHLIVALTKIDLARDEQALCGAIRERLAGTRFSDAQMVLTSTVTGRGLDHLRDRITRTVATLAPHVDRGKPRLAVDRAFSLKGVGTVVTGTLIGGSFQREQPVLVQPAGTKSRVRGLQIARRDVVKAEPGNRVAIHLADVAVRTRDHTSGVGRGDVVTIDGMGVVTNVVDVQLTCVAQHYGSTDGALRLRHGVEVKLHHATQTGVARVRLLDAQTLQLGATSRARLTLDKPMLLLVGDRVVIRSVSERETLCGAIVLDPSPPGGRDARFRPASGQAELLRRRATSPTDLATVVTTQLERDGIVDRTTLGRTISNADSELDETVAALIAKDAAIQRGHLLISPGCWQQSCKAIEHTIHQHHARHPEQRGLTLEQARSAAATAIEGRGAKAAALEVGQAVIDELCKDGYIRSGNVIAHRDHRIALPPRLQSAGDQCRRRLAERPFDPPSRKELCPSDAAVQALKFLIASGEVVEIGPDVVLTAAALSNVVDAIRAHLATRHQATVSELKSLLGSSRRVMVPLLEHLDRTGITRRVGDGRVLAS